MMMVRMMMILVAVLKLYLLNYKIHRKNAVYLN